MARVLDNQAEHNDPSASRHDGHRQPEACQSEGERRGGGCAARGVPVLQGRRGSGLVVYPPTNSYYCWSEKHGGDVLTLASRFWRIPLDEAGRRIAAHFNLSAPRKPAEAENGFDAEVFQRSLDPDAPELAPIGISADTLRFYGGGYCTKPSLKGNLALPVRDIVGTIKFFMGIAIDNHEIVYPKLKGLVVPFCFGVDKLEAGTLHIVHHPIDLLRAVDNNVENVLALLTPVTADVLTSLKALMDAKDLHTIEFH